MANLRVYPERLVVELTAAEKLLAAHRKDVVIDRANIRSATISHDPWVWLRGVRAPGTGIPRSLAVGTWRYHGGRDFVVVKGSRPTVILELDAPTTDHFTRVIISTPRAAELISSLALNAQSDGTQPRKPKRPLARPGEEQSDSEAD